MYARCSLPWRPRRLDRVPLHGAAHGGAPLARRGDSLRAEGAQHGRGAVRPRSRLRPAAGEDPRHARGGRCRRRSQLRVPGCRPGPEEGRRRTCRGDRPRLRAAPVRQRARRAGRACALGGPVAAGAAARRPQRLRGRCRPGEPLPRHGQAAREPARRAAARARHLRHGCACSTCRSRWRRSTSVPPPSSARARRAPRAPPKSHCFARVSRPRTAPASSTAPSDSRCTARSARGSRCAPHRRLPARAALSRAPRAGEHGAALHFAEAMGEAGNRAAGRAVHPGPAARQPAVLLTRSGSTHCRATPIAPRRPAQAPRPGHRHGPQRAQPGPRAGIPARCRHEGRQAFWPGRHLRAARDRRGPAPAAGILTAGAGNPLSHVQAFWRATWGIPNVSVDAALLRTAPSRPRRPRRIVLAVEPRRAGRDPEDGPQCGRRVRRAGRSPTPA